MVDVISVAEAAASGSRPQLVRALRHHIATKIDNGVTARDLAALSLRLLDISGELDAIDKRDRTEVSTAVVTPDEPFDDTNVRSGWGGYP